MGLWIYALWIVYVWCVCMCMYMCVMCVECVCICIWVAYMCGMCIVYVLWHVCAVCEREHMHKYVCTFEGQKLISGVFHSHPPVYVRTGPLPEPRAHRLATMVVRALRKSLFLPFPLLPFPSGWGPQTCAAIWPFKCRQSELRSYCLHDRHFSQRAIPPTPKSSWPIITPKGLFHRKRK